MRAPASTPRPPPAVRTRGSACSIEQACATEDLMCLPAPGGYCASFCGLTGTACAGGACVETARAGELCMKGCTRGCRLPRRRKATSAIRCGRRASSRTPRRSCRSSARPRRGPCAIRRSVRARRCRRRPRRGSISSSRARCSPTMAGWSAMYTTRRQAQRAQRAGDLARARRRRASDRRAVQVRSREPLRSLARARREGHGVRGVARLRWPRPAPGDRVRDIEGRRGDVVGADQRQRGRRLRGRRGGLPRQADDRRRS